MYNGADPFLTDVFLSTSFSERPVQRMLTLRCDSFRVVFE
jgi:hypothetical protein